MLKILVNSQKSRALCFDFLGFGAGLRLRALGLGLGLVLSIFSDVLLKSRYLHLGDPACVHCQEER